jgi:predicted adenylyl cyclase CyaB
MEIEAKYRCDDLGQIISSIKRMGGVLKKKNHQEDSYFIVNQKDKDRHRVYFRVRHDIFANTSSIDYHEVISDFETRETEVKVQDQKAALQIIEKQGYNLICVVD